MNPWHRYVLGRYSNFVEPELAPRLATPVNLRVTQINANSINLAWDAVPGAGGYELGMNISNGEGNISTTTLGKVSSYTVTDLTASTPYDFQLKALPANISANRPSLQANITATTTSGSSTGTSRVFQFNFNRADHQAPDGSNWNSLNGAAINSANASFSAYNNDSRLKDTNGQESGIDVILKTNEIRCDNNGRTTNEHGIPEEALVSYIRCVTDYTVDLVGLDNSKTFDLKIFGSRNFGTPFRTRFAVGSQHGVIDTSNTALTPTPNIVTELKGLVPVGGRISVAVSIDPTGSTSTERNWSGFYLTQNSPQTTPLNFPQNLRTASVTANSVTLTWDAVANAGSYQVRYRISPSGSWTTQNVPSGTSHTVTGLTAATQYDFSVKAMPANTANNTESPFSNNIQATTAAAAGGGPAKTYLLNFNRSGLQEVSGQPQHWNNWNNLNASGTASSADSSAGKKYSDHRIAGSEFLRDTTNAASTIDVELTTAWGFASGAASGFAEDGANAGGNGVYPDAAIRSYLFGEVGPDSLKISGLDPAKQYTLRMLGSRGSVSNNRVTRYSSGGQNADLVCDNNISNRATLTNLLPSSFGEITLTLTPGPGSGSNFTYLNVLEIIEN